MLAKTLAVASLSLGFVSGLAGCGSSTPSNPGSKQSGGDDEAGQRANTGGSKTNGGGGQGDKTGSSGSQSSGVSGANRHANGGDGSGATGGTGGTGGTDTEGGGSNSTGAGGSTGAPGGAAGPGGATAGASGGKAGGPSGSGGSAGGGNGTAGAAPNGEPPTLPVTVNAWSPSDACKAKAAEILGKLDLPKKVAQMIQGETLTTTAEDVKNNQLGAVFGGGSADPPTGNAASAWADMASQYQAAAASFGIPLLYGIDAVHGHNNVKDATMFPHNIGMGCTRDADLVKRVFRATAEEVRGTGINWTFAPTIAAARDERWGRTFESFSEDPAIVAWMGQAAVDGLQQGSKINDAKSILACAKHFAGDGDTASGTDQGDVVMDEATFQRLALNQYQPLINSGVATVMISYSQYGATSASLQRVTGSKALITDLLKTKMGFAGIVVSDYNAIMKLPGGDSSMSPAPTAKQVAAGVNAGLDMLMMAGTGGTDKKANWKATMELLQAAVTATDDTKVPESRIDDAVTRILQVKCEMGMFESGYSVKTDTQVVGSSEHRTVAREAVAKSLVVLKNDNDVLPLDKGAKVFVAGSAADSMVKQCGGWTIDWQGLGSGKGHATDASSTTGTTILAGIRQAIGEGNVTYSQDGSAAAGGATAGIVVVGESPYAEQYGDATDLTLKARSSTDDTTLTSMLGKGIPIVLVVISGRPLILDSYLGNANLRAVVAAWLPGSEGAGVADVLFGTVKPVGKLGHSWPKSMSQIPINFDDTDYTSDAPAFPIGHGLTW